MKRKPSFKFTIKHLIMLLLVGSLLYYIVGLFTVREGVTMRGGKKTAAPSKKTFAPVKKAAAPTKKPAAPTKKPAAPTKKPAAAAPAKKPITITEETTSPGLMSSGTYDMVTGESTWSPLKFMSPTQGVGPTTRV
jgi:hypothetical protein